MSLYDRSAAEASVRGYTRRVEGRREIIQALLGDGAGNIAVSGDPGWVWVRVEGDPDGVAEAKNRSNTPLVDGIVVDLQRVWPSGLGYYELLGISSTVIYESTPVGPGSGSAIVAAHADQHAIGDRGAGGFDPLTVNVRALAPIRARAQAVPNMTVQVDAGYYFINSFKLFQVTTSPAFTAPAAGTNRYDLLYLGSDDALHILTGTPVIGVIPTFPAVPADSIPICFIYLAGTTTAIDETAIVDARVILTAVSPTATAHAILSAVHSDTLAAAVLDGDILIGNMTPKWSRLAITVPAANVRNVLGVDNGELRPSWKSALDATVPTTIGVSDVAAAGTSLIFSHRDHQHGSPATFPATAHNLLSAKHGDTTVASAVLGDIITGQAGPVWARLAISVPAANILNVVGVVNGETVPSWKSIHDATVPTTIAVADAAAAGTALTASHRDHRHGAPATWTPATHDMVSAHSYTGGAALDVFGLSAANTIAKLTPSSNPGAAAAILATNASGLLTLVGLTTTAVASLTTPAESWVGPSSTVGVYFKGGNVGIGTTTPAALLEISSNVSTAFYISTTAPGKDKTPSFWLVNNFGAGGAFNYGGMGLSNVDNSLRFSTTGSFATAGMILATSGNILIGTTTDGMTSAGSIAVAKDLAHRGAALGFYNTAPIAKQTGVAVTAAGIHAACVALGLFAA